MEEILQQILVKLDSLEKGQEQIQKEVIEIKETVLNNKIELESLAKQNQIFSERIFDNLNLLYSKNQINNIKLKLISEKTGYHEIEIKTIKERIQS